jgi:SAM-dependent methyltransferase
MLFTWSSVIPRVKESNLSRFATRACDKILEREKTVPCRFPLYRPFNPFLLGKSMGLKILTFELLRQLGLKTGQTVLDFGCGSGTYAIPAAEIVGQKGRVYVLDKDHGALDELVENSRRAGLQNIERIDSAGKVRIGLERGSIDVVLLFDVFHSYYFPRHSQRGRLLAEIHRILKRDGILLVYPKHMEVEARREIADHDFSVRRECSTTLVHDEKELVHGSVLVFRKNPNGRKSG